MGLNITGTGWVPTAGWYSISLDFELEGRTLMSNPGLYVDFGQGMSEATFVPLPMGGGRETRSLLVFIPGDIYALRFDPSDCAGGSFGFRGLTMRKLSPPEIGLRLAARVFRSSKSAPGGRKALLREGAKVVFDEGLLGVIKRLKAHGSELSARLTYAGWISRFDTIDEHDAASYVELLARLERRPLFSIIVPVYDTPERWLRRCIDSVRAQFYDNWELCLANDASPLPHVAAILDEYAARDPRIRVAHRDRNGHISAASNSALELATGDFVVLLDHDDELRPHALAELALRLAREPTLKLVYSDEDKIDEAGERFDPYFKPAWNPDLLRSQNYLCHLVAYDAALVRELGGFREGYEGSQDHDLALRVVERLRPEEIGHIPKVLYHWRAIAGSTAKGIDQKQYANEAGRLALQSHVDRVAPGTRVEPAEGGHFRLRWPIPDPPPLVSLVIPTRDRVELVRVAVSSIRERSTYPNIEILIVDNQSQKPETLSYFAELEASGAARVLRYDEPFNYSAINNFAVREARGELVGLVNNDIEVITPDWLEEMVGHALRPEIGVVGAMLYYPDDTIQHAGVIVGVGGVAGHAYSHQPRGYPGQMNRARLAQNLTAVTAACLVVRKSVFDEVEGLDESLRIAFNDIDFCLRVAARGYRNVWTPFAELYHHESASRGYEDSPEKVARFYREIDRMKERWGDALECDPAYNPNLSLTSDAFALAVPPRLSRCDG